MGEKEEEERRMRREEEERKIEREERKRKRGLGRRGTKEEKSIV